jgi:hypothetical protein
MLAPQHFLFLLCSLLIRWFWVRIPGHPSLPWRQSGDFCLGSEVVWLQSLGFFTISVIVFPLRSKAVNRLLVFFQSFTLVMMEWDGVLTNLSL